jgi:hypothetical protein
MPPWAGIMSEKELEDCLAYLRLLGPAANSNSSDNGDDED